MFLPAEDAAVLVQGEGVSWKRRSIGINWFVCVFFQAVLLEKLKYAIHFCKSIDTDEYARVAMGDPAEMEDSDLESIASHIV